MKISVKPLTPERWPDLESIFNAKGCSIARRCWCMYYRRSGSSSELAGAARAKANRAALHALTHCDPPPGLIGYRSKVPVGWISLGPREHFPKLQRSPVMKPVDKASRSADDALWFGVKSMYDAAGFDEVARRRPERPVVRLRLG